VTERRDIPDALRDAVERTVKATIDRRTRAQDAMGDLAGTVDQVVKGAEKNISRSGKTVRAAVEERMPATQDDLKEIRSELRRISKRLDALEAGAGRSTKGRPTKSKPRSKPGPSKAKSKSKR
jgi:hypothetical protein